ncbi:glycoside hydrolase family 127 protein [Labedella endophytica]|uniref:Glycoside hydrolase family 127 protein n=1 Tax=Labedella endophytica TaxID=1523160 RepID=A0A3S0XD53_9MICO|nr:beta-L-arabinofuranosidase domain-containing protein [Labedella endophytica]RUR03108.1 glycoside hydrolase family 127 protein [Labedella endophytica]
MTSTSPLTRTPPSTPASAAVPVDPARSDRRGAGVDDVRLSPTGFWGRRQLVNGEATIAHCLDWIERLDWLENIDRVARRETTVERAGWQFSDSEIYKLLEAMAWELGRRDDPALEATFASVVGRVAAAQDDDGYLGTAFGHPGLPERYSDLGMGHELYNLGHLLQAAVARVRTRGEDALVEVARRAADHVCREFGADGRDGICGHPEIEVGLAEFGRALGEPRYVEQARLFVDRRGHGSLPVPPLQSAEYFQDDTPVLDAEALRGHAVRALYLSAGAVDVAVDGGDDALLEALRRQWDHTVERRTYLTGGMGSRHQDEGFGEDFELPADRGYCETCAGVGSVMFSWRLYLATGEVRYVDLIERTLFNVVATSPASDGRSFFYANPLHQREAGAESTDGVNTRAEGGTRAPWFEVSCCPTNVARTLASLPAYVAALDGDTAVLLQYADGRVHIGDVLLDVQTRYPDDGVIRIEILDAPAHESTVRLRVPAWANDAHLVEPDSDARPVEPGWVDVRRRFTAGDVITLDLRITPRFTFPDPRVDAVRGTVAVERGPLVLCLESVDLPDGVTIDDVAVDTTAAPVATIDGATVSGVVVTSGERAPGALPYGANAETPTPTSDLDIALVPYHRWAERGPATMRVFIPTADGRNTTAATDGR